MNLNIFRENEGRPELNVIVVRKGLLSTPASKRDWLANCVDTRASFAGQFNPLTAEWALRALIDFTLSNARRFYSSMGNLLDAKGLIQYSFSLKCIKLVGHDLKRKKKERTLPCCFLYLNSEGCVQQKQCTGRERDQYSIAHFHGVESGYTRQIQSILDFAHDKPLFLGKVMYHFDRPWNSWTRAQ